MNEEIKTALIGAGNMGKNHARVLSEIPHTKLVAVSDINPSIGQPLADKFNAAYYRDYREMLDEQQIDALSVVVPTNFHRQVVLESLALGIPTLVEKPIASTLEDAAAMIDAMKQTGTFLMVGHIERFNPAVTFLKSMIDAGRLGNIVNLMARRVGIAPPKSPSDVALDLGIHDIDVFNYLLSQEPEWSHVERQKIYEQSIADSATILLRYPAGATAVLHTNWITEGDKVRNMYITGTHATAEINYINQVVDVFEGQRRIAKSGDYLTFLSVSERALVESHKFSKEPLREELEYFLRESRTKTECDVTYSAYAALKALINE